jgi:Fe-S cluster biogenesis protein NfuA
MFSAQTLVRHPNARRQAIRRACKECVEHCAHVVLQHVGTPPGLVVADLDRSIRPPPDRIHASVYQHVTAGNEPAQIQFTAKVGGPGVTGAKLLVICYQTQNGRITAGFRIDESNISVAVRPEVTSVELGMGRQAPTRSGRIIKRIRGHLNHPTKVVAPGALFIVANPARRENKGSGSGLERIAERRVSGVGWHWLAVYQVSRRWLRNTRTATQHRTITAPVAGDGNGDVCRINPFGEDVSEFAEVSYVDHPLFDSRCANSPQLHHPQSINTQQHGCGGISIRFARRRVSAEGSSTETNPAQFEHAIGRKYKELRPPGKLEPPGTTCSSRDVVCTAAAIEHTGPIGELFRVAVEGINEAALLLGAETGGWSTIEERIEIRSCVGLRRSGVELNMCKANGVVDGGAEAKRSGRGRPRAASVLEPIGKATRAGRDPCDRPDGQAGKSRAALFNVRGGAASARSVHAWSVTTRTCPQVSPTAVVQIGWRLWQTTEMSDVMEALSDDAKAERLKALQSVIDLIRPVVQQDGGDLALVSADVEVGIVEVQLQGSCSSCAVSSTTLQAGVSRILKDRLPWVTDVLGGVDESIDTETSRAMGMGGYVPRE